MAQSKSRPRLSDFLAEKLASEGADAYVHVGDQRDDLLRYLSGFNGPDREYAFVFTGDEPILCTPDSFEEQAEREFTGKIDELGDTERLSAPERALRVLDRVDANHILVPDSISYAAYRDLRSASLEITPISGFWKIRSRKSRHEISYLRDIEEIAQSAMATAETILANATVSDDSLIWRCKPLTTERLRREINAALSKMGAQDRGNTVVGTGPSCAELHFNGDTPVKPDQTVLIDLAPRGPHGYFGDITRTFVPGEVGSWEEEVYNIVREALQAGFEVLEEAPGIPARSVHDRICEIIESHGYGTGDVDVGLYHGTGHGIGTTLHEPPFFSTEQVLEEGNVVTIEPGLYDPSRGGVRLEDVVRITDDGFENLVDYPLSMEPSVRSV